MSLSFNCQLEDALILVSAGITTLEKVWAIIELEMGLNVLMERSSKLPAG
jgi:hypothetical protein